MSKTAKAQTGVSGEDAVIAALGAKTEATAAELAEQAGLGRSTVSGLLAGLERRGKVRREAGGRDSGRRLPDRWTRAGQRPRRGTRRTSGGARPGSADRLSPGALDELVLEYMRGHRDGPLGPGMIAKGIDKSSGAVANCLVRLARDEQVREVSEHPIRYSLTAERGRRTKAHAST